MSFLAGFDWQTGLRRRACVAATLDAVANLQFRPVNAFAGQIAGDSPRTVASSIPATLSGNAEMPSGLIPTTPMEAAAVGGWRRDVSQRSGGSVDPLLLLFALLLRLSPSLDQS